MKKTSLLTDVLKGLLVASAAIIAMPHLAFAATDLNTVAGTADTEMSSIPTIISVCFYIGGAAFCGSGLLKLKQYADNPGVNAKLGEGVGRLAVGAGLLALPFISDALINSLGLTGAAAPTWESFNQGFQ
jgi:hypothetical protein